MNSDTQEKPSNHYAIVIYQSILKTCFIWQLVSFWILNWNFSFASVWQILQHPSSQGLFQYFSSFYASLHAYNVHTALCNALSNSLQYDSWAQSSHTHTHRATGWLALCTGGKLDRISSSFLKRQRKNGIYYRAEAVFSGYTAAD